MFIVELSVGVTICLSVGAVGATLLFYEGKQPVLGARQRVSLLTTVYRPTHSAVVHLVAVRALTAAAQDAATGRAASWCIAVSSLRLAESDRTIRPGGVAGKRDARVGGRGTDRVACMGLNAPCVDESWDKFEVLDESFY